MTRYYYFPDIPLDVCTPANAERYDKRALALDRPELIKSIKESGQLDPLLATVRGSCKFVVEPGQGRWYVLNYLYVVSTFLLVRVEPEHEDIFEQQFSGHQREEIKTFEEAEKLFKHTNRESHTGVGYLMRRGWLYVKQQP